MAGRVLQWRRGSLPGSWAWPIVWCSGAVAAPAPPDPPTAPAGDTAAAGHHLPAEPATPRARVPPVRFDARLLVVAAAVLWGTTGTARALGPEHAAPAAVGAARLVVGGACLALLGWRLRWIGPHSRAVAGRGNGGGAGGAGTAHDDVRVHHRRAVAIAATAMAAYQPLFFGGVARTGVAVGTMVGIGSAPVFAGLLGLAVRGERPDRRWLVATGLALAGTVLLVGAGDRDDVDVAGLALASGAGAAYAVYVAGSKVLIDAGRRPDAVVARVFGLAALALVPVAVVAGVGPLVSPAGALMVAHLGLVTVVVGYLLFGRGLAGVGVGTAGTLTLAEPATATVLGVAVLGERPGVVTVAGLVLVAAGLVALVAPGRRAPGGPARPARPDPDAA
ncbi:MAG TPA: DMT family transporter [Acidimicrobiales bacterium]|nr:DMT family transporter [Acidimicrobiales bacterium]